MKSLLPVTIVLPILNCVEKLGEHLDQLEPTLERIEAVVVVDSHSIDGSLELVRDRIRHPRVQFLSVPPGLYAAWNSGIEAAQTAYVCISTIGDWISPDGLDHLVEVAESFSADVVISPPRCVDSARRISELRQFPIHQLMASGCVSKPLPLPPWLAFTLATGFSIESLLGSSASNLYRSRCLQQEPFPTDFGKAGDTAWFRRVALELRIAVTPLTVADFLLDQDHGCKEPGEVSKLLERLNQISDEALHQWKQSHAEEAGAIEFLNAWRDIQGASPEKTLDAIRHLEGIAATNEQQRAYIAELQEEIQKMRGVMELLDATCAERLRTVEDLKATSGAEMLSQALKRLFGGK